MKIRKLEPRAQQRIANI